jgi:hypothetical protein
MKEVLYDSVFRKEIMKSKQNGYYRLIDIVDVVDNKPVEKIKLEIEILRSKEKRTRHCVYGPGKKSFGHKCVNCETHKMICISVEVEIDDTGFSYVSSGNETIKSLLELCNPALKIKQG